MNSVNLLLQSLPPWIEIEERKNGESKLIATPPLPGGGPSHEFRLVLRPSSQGGVTVIEQDARRKFPDFCLERHINPDSTFCLYYGSEEPLVDSDAAIGWWSSLATFLANQIYADRHHVWPLAAGLSHGDAAQEQLKMEAISEPLGWKDEILRSMFRGKGWLAENLPRLSKGGHRIVNSRSPCPRGCTWKHKLLRRKSCDNDGCYSDCQRQHKSILRRDCPHRSAIEKLVLHEHRRLKIEENITKKLLAAGKKCCGTMKFCPLHEKN